MARYRNGTEAEVRIELNFQVEDENDNAPVFLQSVLSVNESSPEGKMSFSATHSKCTIQNGCTFSP